MSHEFALLMDQSTRDGWDDVLLVLVCFLASERFILLSNPPSSLVLLAPNISPAMRNDIKASTLIH